MRLWRLLLRLYPADHRRAYGDEMLAMVEYRWERAGRGLLAGLMASWDLIAGAIGMQMDRLGRKTMGMGRGWLLDVRFVARALAKSGGYVATTVLVLAAAVAVNTTVFSYTRGTLLADAPYPDADRVMVVWGSNVRNGKLRDVISGPNYIDLQDGTSALDPLAAFHHDGDYLLIDGRPEVHDVIRTSVRFFDVLKVQPYLGRLFEESDRMSGGTRAVVVTHGFWRDRLDADPGAVGSTLPFEDGARTIVGVLPEDFEFVAPAPFFEPLHDDVLAADGRTRIHYNVLGRLASGASLEDAHREMNAVMQGIVVKEPAFEGWSFLAEPLHQVSVEAVRPVILILSATVALVLLVALVNLATLFRIRAMARGDELSVRHALGAGRYRLVRVLALETAVLAASGAVLGLAAAPFLLEHVAGVLPVWIAIPDSAARVPALQGTLTPGVALATFVGAVAGALLLAIPTFAGTGGARLASGSGARVRSGIGGVRALVGVEVAVATLLCILAGLTARSAANVLSTEVGVEAEGVLTLAVADVWDLPEAEQVTYFRDIVAAVEELPGVQRAGVMDYVDFQAEDDFARVYFLDRALQPTRDMREEWRRIDEGLFEAAGMAMLAGRAFEQPDFEGKPRAAVVNRAFAEKHYPDGTAIGELLSTHDADYRDLTVVGVVADVRSLGPAAPAPPMLYVPNQGSPRGHQGMYVRVTGEPMASADRVREAIWSVDPSQPIASIIPLEQLVARWTAIPLATRTLVLSLAVLAMALSAVGVFGVVAYAVRTRRAELGVRLALGASPARLEKDLVARVLPIAIVAVLVGAAAGLGVARAASAVLHGVDPIDLPSIMMALLAMTAATGLATWLPARRVGRIDPTEAMRPD